MKTRIENSRVAEAGRGLTDRVPGDDEEDMSSMAATPRAGIRNEDQQQEGPDAAPFEREEPRTNTKLLDKELALEQQSPEKVVQNSHSA